MSEPKQLTALTCKCGVQIDVALIADQEVAAFECARCSGTGLHTGVLKGAVDFSRVSIRWGFALEAGESS
jgi:hypothetical protein